MTKKNGKPSTYDRVVDISLKLFNEEGERKISTNHIAQALGISPGNLYYHFRNKDEIIVQLFQRYSSKLLDYIQQTPLPDNMAKMGDYMSGVYDILWEYRFLFSDVNTMLTRSKQLLGEHNEFTHIKISPLLVRIFTDLRAKGILDADDEALRELGLNVWLLTKYWFDFDNSQHIGNWNEGAKRRGIYQTMSLVRGFVAKEHYQNYCELMAQYRS
ncbi:TetR/AcrR family transcriptional regulator [Eikenella sp. S3360]|uniref:TetR/AcrR family transcriptional regulator n=1 Tax=Eikenella glucosivorans TaxID=2766967 RepID=A0ABS0N997_9NEIS|nr:TetR/AcrR family transcriptional regulator [Eikenella glucosivorans]MBH5328883.1 TetR/AcrR family transcriptional regulator [Eikenella glucosivorans]